MLLRLSFESLREREREREECIWVGFDINGIYMVRYFSNFT